MSSSGSLLLSARVAVATYHFADGPFRLLSDALRLARRAGIARAEEGMEMSAPLLAPTDADPAFDRRLTEMRDEYEYAYRTHVPVWGEYYMLSIRNEWVGIRSLERDDARGEITVSAQSAPEIFRLLKWRPQSYRFRRDFMMWGGSHFVRMDDPTTSHFGQLYLETGHPSRGSLYFGDPKTEHFHLSALLALEQRVLALAGSRTSAGDITAEHTA
ncbi:hypothetical protein [Burkholderia sp. 4M9327F10]|jgi:hypothetical protein|uniref:hypothetical protein n=3 Tax=Burkholderiaceae TaxID=119060 RepID=UPI001BB1E022|nr:hypothetical protein [Burkholderia sp. 4M9327F10]